MTTLSINYELYVKGSQISKEEYPMSERALREFPILERAVQNALDNFAKKEWNTQTQFHLRSELFLVFSRCLLVKTVSCRNWDRVRHVNPKSNQVVNITFDLDLDLEALRG